MKKALSFFLSLLFLLPLVTACHGKVTQASFLIPETFDASREYTVSFWAKNESNQNQVDIYKKAIADFEALYPNIHVQFRSYTDYGMIYRDVITNLKTGTTPNVCITYPDHIATYMSGENTVVALDALFDDPKYGLGGSEVLFDGPKKEEIVPEFLEECRIAGQTYAVPFMRSTEACYINKTYVEKLGFSLPEVLTWDFMWEVAEAAMKTKGEDGVFSLNGQKTLIPIIYKSTDNMMIQMIRQKDGEYSTDTGEILLFNDTTRELLKTVAAHAKTRAFSTFKISSYPGNFLNAGQCIFGIDSTAGATWMGSDAPMLDIHKSEVVDYEMAVMTVPQFDVEHPQMISQGPSVCIFNKEDPQIVLASWLFCQFLLTNSVQIAYSETEGYLPVTLKAREDPVYREYISDPGDATAARYRIKLEASRLLLNHVKDTFTTPVFNGSTSLRDASGQMIEDVTNGVRRKKTVDDAFIDELYRRVTELYALDQITLSGDFRRSLGDLPAGSVALISVLVLTWAGIGAFFLRKFLRKRKNAKNSENT